jgi:hypothetical protein
MSEWRDTDEPVRRRRKKKSKVGLVAIGLAVAAAVFVLVGVLLIASALRGRPSTAPGVNARGTPLAPAAAAGTGRLRQLLVGTWDATIPDGSTVSTQFNADGTFRFTGHRDGRELTDTGHWEVLSEHGDRAQVRRSTFVTGISTAAEFVFSGNDSFTVSSGDASLTYRRHR